MGPMRAICGHVCVIRCASSLTGLGYGGALFTCGGRKSTARQVADIEGAGHRTTSWPRTSSLLPLTTATAADWDGFHESHTAARPWFVPLRPPTWTFPERRWQRQWVWASKWHIMRDGRFRRRRRIDRVCGFRATPGLPRMPRERWTGAVRVWCRPTGFVPEPRWIPCVRGPVAERGRRRVVARPCQESVSRALVLLTVTSEGCVVVFDVLATRKGSKKQVLCDEGGKVRGAVRRCRREKGRTSQRILALVPLARVQTRRSTHSALLLTKRSDLGSRFADEDALGGARSGKTFFSEHITELGRKPRLSP